MHTAYTATAYIGACIIYWYYKHILLILYYTIIQPWAVLLLLIYGLFEKWILFLACMVYL